MEDVQQMNTHVSMSKSTLSPLEMQTEKFKAWYEPDIASKRFLVPGSAASLAGRLAAQLPQHQEDLACADRHSACACWEDQGSASKVWWKRVVLHTTTA